MEGKIEYQFSAEMRQYTPPGGWYFITMPQSLSREIRDNLGWQEEGWGRMKAIAQIGDVIWKSAIWFDTKSEAYALPVKAEIRKKINLKVNKKIELRIWI